MTTQRPRPGQLIRKIETVTPRIFQGLLYPLITGVLRISASLIKNIFWLFIALIGFLVGGLHRMLENLKDMNQNEPEQ